jgi:hypothetical protein
MPALVAGIHEFDRSKETMDGRDKPGHDGNKEGALYFVRPEP